MIVNKFIEIKITKKNINHFIQFYKDIKLRDIIQIDPKHLQNNSNTYVDVSCDLCGVNRNIIYQAYYRNINSCEEYPIYTCDKCSHVKIKAYNMKKYGVEYYSKTKEYTTKFKNTMVERYGVEYSTQSEEIKEKIKQTTLKNHGVDNIFKDNNYIKEKFSEKWGVDHPSKVKEINDRIKRTNLERYGYENTLNSPEIRKRINQTNSERYGGHPMKNKNILDKMSNTNLERYGYNFILEDREKIATSYIVKYGVDNPMMSEEVRKNLIISKDPNYLKYLSESISLFKCNQGHNFEIHIDNYHTRRKQNINLCTICHPIGDSRSIKENEVFKFIQSIYGGEIIQSYRNELEIDIYLPELKLGFEFNGLYWHSEEYKDKYYHLNKTKHFKERGIRVIHIWEDDWDSRSEIIQSQIRNWLGRSEKIGARKCQVKEIKDSKVVMEFLDRNHIQGRVGSSVKLGLYNGSELVSVMTFDQFEGRKKMEERGWNLNRFCNRLGVSVLGGASRLLNYFIQTYGPTRIVSYADQEWSDGDMYQKLGFVKIEETKPDYKYLVENQRVHKSNFKKSRLKLVSGTENSYMKERGFYRIWDCGKIKFELRLN
jgi:hypothetical protein